MSPALLAFRLFAEPLAMIASVEAAIKFLLPVITPGVDGAANGPARHCDADDCGRIASRALE